MSNILRKIRRSAASHAAKLLDWKVTWYDVAGNVHSRRFPPNERHRAWGWFHAKCNAGRFAAIYAWEDGAWVIKGGQYGVG